MPAGKLEEYRDYSKIIDALFIEKGALRVVDTWGDDVPAGKLTDFHRAVAATEGETVVFGWIEWPDKATRTAGFAALESDERMTMTPPFDTKRMIFGGFESLSVLEK